MEWIKMILEIKMKKEKTSEQTNFVFGIGILLITVTIVWITFMSLCFPEYHGMIKSIERIVLSFGVGIVTIAIGLFIHSFLIRIFLIDKED